MKDDKFDLKGLIEDIGSEVYDEMGEGLGAFHDIVYSSNFYMEFVTLPEIHLVDTENYSLYDDEEKTATEKTLEAIYENTSNLESFIKSYNKVLKKRLDTFEKLRELGKALEEKNFQIPYKEPERRYTIGVDLGETDLDKPGEFDNRRFE